MFRDGRDETMHLASPGQVHKVVTDTLIVDIDTVVTMNRRRNIRYLGSEFNFLNFSSTITFEAFLNNDMRVCLNIMSNVF